MQDYNWNDLKYFLALYRFGTLAEAGRKTDVSETTIARRIRSMEKALETRLFFKNGWGRYELSDAGRSILSHAEAIERDNVAFCEQLGQVRDAISGVVRISSVPFIINQVLIPNTGTLVEEHPNLNVELMPESRNVDLNKREADLAIRFSRPLQGGLSIKAQKLAELEFGVFCSNDYAQTSEDQVYWVGYEDASRSLPQAEWTETLRRQSKGRLTNILVADIGSALEAAASGLGKAVLPKIAARLDNRLQPLALDFVVKRMSRDVWLLSHGDQTDRQSVIAAKTWLHSLPWG